MSLHYVDGYSDVNCLQSTRWAGRQARTTELPSTATPFSGSGFFAGPAVGVPSATANLLPWHGQLIVPPTTSLTLHPWWVQVALNPLNVPASGWVTTRSWSARTIPPPTGTSATAATAPGLAAVPPAVPAASLGAAEGAEA